MAFSSFLPSTEQNLILTGYVGTNMPVLSREIAEYLGLPFVDVEALFAQRVDLTPDEIRAYYGETRLKAVEMEIMQETALRRHSLIRVSGRTLMHSGHLQRLQATGLVICLTISMGAMLRKLHSTMGARYHDPAERGLAIGEIRREWAINDAEGIHRVDTNGLEADAIIEAVADLWRLLAVQRG